MSPKIILSVLLGGSVLLLFYLYEVLLLKPKRPRSKLEEQGIKGPCPVFILGKIPEMKSIKVKVMKELTATETASTTTSMNHQHVCIAHDWPSTIFPHLVQWKNEYGRIFMYSTGDIQQVLITDIEMVKEISLCTSLSLGKPSYLSKDRRPLLGQGILL